MSLSTPSSGLKQEVETRIERIDEVESQSDLPSAIEFYEELNEKLHRLAESDTASPRAGKRIEYVEERLSELYDVQESATETPTRRTLLCRKQMTVTVRMPSWPRRPILARPTVTVSSLPRFRKSTFRTTSAAKS